MPMEGQSVKKRSAKYQRFTVEWLMLSGGLSGERITGTGAAVLTFNGTAPSLNSVR